LVKKIALRYKLQQKNKLCASNQQTAVYLATSTRLDKVIKK